MSAATAARIRARLDALGLALPETRVAQMAAYLEILFRWNRKINLTALSLDPLTDESIDRLIAEPVVASRLAGDATTAVDVGAGGGSPAIPLRIAAPQLRLTMVEARERKSAFLREAARALGLDGTEVVTDRFERWAASAGPFDLATMRAVDMTPDLARGLAAVVSPGGQFLWFRSRSAGRLGPEWGPGSQWRAREAIRLPSGTDEVDAYTRLHDQ